MNDPFTDHYKKVSYAILVPTPDVSLRRSFNHHCIWTNSVTKKVIKHTALGLEYVPYAEARPVNGVLVEITDAKMEEIIKREKGYRRIYLPMSLFVCQSSVCNRMKSVTVFIPAVLHHPTKEYPVRQEYIDICIGGFSKCSQAYVDLFMATTEWDWDWVWGPDGSNRGRKKRNTR